MTEEKRINNSFSHNEELFHDLKVLFILLSITILLFVVNSLTTQSVTNSAESSDLNDFLKGVAITDINGNPIKDGTLYVDCQYIISLHFTEGGALGIQFKPDDQGHLTYQIPDVFKVTAMENVDLKVMIDGEEKSIGKYSISEDGKLTIEVSEEGKKILENSTSIAFDFKVTVTAQASPSGGDGSVHFGDSGGSFDFNLTDDAKLDVEKYGYYTEDKKGEDGSNPKGGTLSYTVKTTVEHGEVHDVVISDVLTPPKNESFTIETEDNKGIPNVTVKIKKNGKEEVTLQPEDYELKSVIQDSEGPYQQKSFELKLKDTCTYLPLSEGDVVEVTYEYRVEYQDKGKKYWDEVENKVTVEGKQKIKNPSEGEEAKKVTESDDTKVGVSRNPIGGGKLVKDQEYNEKEKLLHYTVYAVVPQGEWEPFFIFDGMSTNINGENYSLSEFNEDGRVKNVKVSAIDLTDEMITWEDETAGPELYNQLKKVDGEKKELKGYDYNSDLTGYKSDDMNEYVVRYGGTSLHIIFGLQDGQNNDGNWDKWGHYKYDKDRLIILEYDLDLSDDKLSLKKDNEKEPKEFPKEEVLHPGITNSVQFHYDGYSMGTYSFYNDSKKIEKKGTFDKNTNTIEYTVSINLTDNEVRAYLTSVTDDWSYVGEKHSWDYNHSMQAVFYDILPEGWEYVPDSLYAVSLSWGKETKWPYRKDAHYPESKTETIDGKSRNVIEAPLVYFQYYDSNHQHHDMYATTFKDNNYTQITFHYKIKATDEYIQQHAEDDKDTIVHNTAMFKDKTNNKWSDDEDVAYFPTRLIKDAKQEGNSNLMRFTLTVNPSGVNLDKNNDYLIVTDTSTGLQIQTDTITVKDSSGKVLQNKGPVTVNDNLNSNEWGTLETDESSQFKLRVPDGKSLTITYDALITSTGESVPISNSASIDSVGKSDTSYSGTLQVNDVYGGGAGSTYKLTIAKTEKNLSTKKLPGATFEFCIVLSGETELTKTNDITIGDKSYECYRKDDWKFTTDENGRYVIEKDANWNLEPGHYYILKEIEAPPGYYLPEEPILFYYGPENEIDKGNYPTAVFALPNGTLNITNEKTHNIPRTGSIGTRVFYVTGLLLIILAISLIYKKSKIK